MKYKTIRALPYLKQYLKENDIRIKDLINMTGYSRSTVSLFVNGYGGTSRKVWHKVAKVLEINQDLIAEVVIMDLQSK